ncbi:MAG: hypothetical protein Q4A55_01890 [Aerococcus sp.]|nr:hypothetical protein [Aerococcus sp.]
MNKETKTALIALGGLAVIGAVAALICHEEEENQTISNAVDDLSQKFEESDYPEKIEDVKQAAADKMPDIPAPVKMWLKSLV